MLAKLRSHLTFANVIACVALFVALGGTSVAAVSLKKNSVGSSQIKNSSLTGSDIKNSSLTTSDVKDRSLLAKDFKAGQLPAGARGATGLTGPQGAAGATNVVVRTGTTSAGPNASGGVPVSASCHAGERAVGGGAQISPAVTGDILVNDEPFPDTGGATPTQWKVQFNIVSTGQAQTITAYAVCASP